MAKQIVRRPSAAVWPKAGYPAAISRIAKIVLLSAVLAVVFGPRLAAHASADLSASALTAAVLAPTTVDHDAVAPDIARSKTTLVLAAVLVAAVFAVAPTRRWRNPAPTPAQFSITWPERLQPRRGPPVLPA
jgi:hypothetical protein